MHGSPSSDASTPSPDPREDTAGLLARIRAGDRDAASRLFENSYPRLRQAVRLRIPRPLRVRADVDDLVQGALVKALGGLERFEYRGKGSFHSWLVRIAERTLVDAVRSETRRSHRRDNGVGADAPGPDVAELAESGRGSRSAARTPSQHAMHHEDLELLEQAIDALGDEDRELLVENQILGVDLEELAERHGRTAEAIRLKIYRAKNRLAAWLERHG